MGEHKVHGFQFADFSTAEIAALAMLPIKTAISHGLNKLLRRVFPKGELFPHISGSPKT